MLYSLLLVSSSAAHQHVHDFLTVPGEGLFQTQRSPQHTGQTGEPAVPTG